MGKTFDSGYDNSKPPTGYSDRNVEVGEDQDYSDYLSYTEVLGELRDALYIKGWDLIPSPTGPVCGFNLYRETSSRVPGLETPANWKYFKKTSLAEDGIRGRWISDIKLVMASLLNEDKAHNKKLQTLVADLIDNTAKPFSITRNVAVALIEPTERKRHTLTGVNRSHKWVPPLEWFPEPLRSYDASQLLTLFPPAERQQLMLALGRVVAGADKTELIEGKIQHTARMFTLIVGQGEHGAGTGKSTLLNYLLEALNDLGFVTEPINPDLNRFGWAAVALSDLAYIDDLQDEVQKKLLSMAQVKSIVSNGLLKTEDKGINAQATKSSTVLLGLTNGTNYSHYLGMDPGQISRLNQLNTYTTTDLERLYPDVPDARIRQFWEAEAKRLDSHTTTLMVRLLKQCLDLFLDVTGHTIVDGVLYKEPERDRLEQVVKANRAQFQIDVNLRHVEEVVRVAAHMVAMSLAKEGTQDSKAFELFSRRLTRLDFGPEVLKAMLTLFVEWPDPVEPFEALKFDHLSLESIEYIKPKLGDFKALASAKSVEGAFQVLIGELKSTKGFGYPTRSLTYQQQWLTWRRQIPALAVEYQARGINKDVLAEAHLAVRKGISTIAQLVETIQA